MAVPDINPNSSPNQHLRGINKNECLIVPKAMCTYSWIIQNFSQYRTLPDGSELCKYFKTRSHNEDLNWKISCYNTSIHLKLISSKNKLFSILGTILILNFQNRIVYSESNERTISLSSPDPLNTTLKFTNIISGVELFDSEADLFPNDVLTIRCDIVFLKSSSPSFLSEHMKNCVSVIATLNILQKDFSTLFESQILSDFIIRVKGKEFHVHKAILGARSPVFATMFEQDMLEKSENCVEITDSESHAILEMLHFIYTGEVTLDKNLAIELLTLADKYAIDSLKPVCEKFLIGNIDIKTAARILSVSDLHGALTLKGQCMKFICLYASTVVDTVAWKSLEQERPDLVLELFRAQAKSL